MIPLSDQLRRAEAREREEQLRGCTCDWEPMGLLYRDPRCPVHGRRITMAEPRLPPGYAEVEAGVFEGPLHRDGDGYSGRCRVTLGTPDSDDETHNCDAMGCGQDHVLKRERLVGDRWEVM